ncbi:RNA polymerase sigma factor [Chitinophaga sp. NPDC101104]|uniref:RNA polymerase sigma factor n=1 Tax=Chitinophaga sp. NPDC101104 TaxID=3390561 RepID=UPI003D004EB1
MLLREIADGDGHAFATLVVHYGPLLEKAVFQAIRTEWAVKDIVQDVLLQIWLDREKLPELENPRTWFFRIAYYRSYAWLRHRGVQERGQVVMQGSALPGPALHDTEQRLLLSETRRKIAAAVAQLPPRMRTIYLMSREELLRPAEIAGKLGLSVQTVKNTLTNALVHLRDSLARQGILLPLVLFMMI